MNMATPDKCEDFLGPIKGNSPGRMIGRQLLFSITHSCKCISNFLHGLSSWSTQLDHDHTHPLNLGFTEHHEKGPISLLLAVKSLWPKQNCNSLQEQGGPALSLLAEAGFQRLNKPSRQSPCPKTSDLSPSLFSLQRAKAKLWQQSQHGAKGFKWLFFCM